MNLERLFMALEFHVLKWNNFLYKNTAAEWSDNQEMLSIIDPYYVAWLIFIGAYKA